MFKREHHVVLPPEINLWVALTALIERLDQSMKEIGGRSGWKQATIWATDTSTLSRKTVHEAFSAIKENGLTADWCSATSVVGPLTANRGRYDVRASADPEGNYYLYVEVSSSQKILANALSATVTEFAAALEENPGQVSEREIERLKEARTRRGVVRAWLSTHASGLAVNTLSAILGGLIVGLILLFGFGIK